MRFASWILVIVVAVGFAAFAVANREWVEVSLAPLPFSFGLPLFAIIIVVLLFGTLIGGAAPGSWSASYSAPEPTPPARPSNLASRCPRQPPSAPDPVPRAPRFASG